MRVFFCLPIPASVRAGIESVSKRLRDVVGEPASWVRPENYHITVRFLGDIDPMLTLELESLVRDIVGSFSPFDVAIDRIGAFPSMDRARVLWVGGPDCEPFSSLTAALNGRLEALGFPADRKAATVHVTIARVKGSAAPQLPGEIAGLNPLPGWSVRIDRVVLMESRLLPGGAAYTPLFTVQLSDLRHRGEEAG